MMCLRMMLTNARSLSPKIHSLITMFDELQLHFAVVTESWLKDGQTLDRDVIDLEYGTDLKIIYKNRPTKQASRRRVGGGVSIIYSKARCNLRERRIASGRFEIVIATGKIAPLSRDVAIFAVYIEPKMLVSELDKLRDIISANVLQLKANAKGEGPLFFIAGDVNRRDLAPSFDDFNDIRQINHEPTRGQACLDIIFSNATEKHVANFPPLESREGTKATMTASILKLLRKSKSPLLGLRKRQGNTGQKLVLNLV